MNCNKCSKEMCQAENQDGTCIWCLEPKPWWFHKRQQRVLMKRIAQIIVAVIVLLYNGAHHFELQPWDFTSQSIWEDAYEICDKRIPEAVQPDAEEIENCKIEPVICTGPVMHGKRQDLMRECTWSEARKICRKYEPDVRICGQ